MNTRLLVADSDPSLADLCRRFFSNREYSNREYEVAMAASGLECLAKLRDVLPVALVLEWELPWGGGDGVLACMREEPLLRDTPVVIITSDLPCDQPLEILEAGLYQQTTAPPVIDCLAKPFHLAVLLDVLSWVDRRSLQLASLSD